MIGRGSRPGVQRRKVRRDGWTMEVRAKFLEVLGDTCNVTTAAAAVGKSPRGARAVKKRDGEFAQLWAEIFEQGQERLREELTACALGQMPSGNNPEKIDVSTTPAPFDPQLALKVLQLQNGTHHSRKRVGGAPAQADVDQALLERLEALAERLARA